MNTDFLPFGKFFSLKRCLLCRWIIVSLDKHRSHLIPSCVITGNLKEHCKTQVLHGYTKQLWIRACNWMLANWLNLFMSCKNSLSLGLVRKLQAVWSCECQACSPFLFSWELLLFSSKGMADRMPCSEPLTCKCSKTFIHSISSERTAF